MSVHDPFDPARADLTARVRAGLVDVSALDAEWCARPVSTPCARTRADGRRARDEALRATHERDREERARIIDDLDGLLAAGESFVLAAAAVGYPSDQRGMEALEARCARAGRADLVRQAARAARDAARVGLVRSPHRPSRQARGGVSLAA